MSKCSLCHNELAHRNILYLQWCQEKLVAVENVPADVCPNCGEEYFSPEVVNQLQKVIETNHYSRTMEIPVFQLR
ncbi:MAG: type II toxin-antitoxin system MqsA family antitoxin [Planctomycetota bacterium]|nr:type II toxin-antitoxin system MqsA family antitoxin [Planctomycetota bacterium]MDI6787230.1 type II toxin-antitoxin system MqsA family antitoxin [Planctomycetota bacterium]